MKTLLNKFRRLNKQKNFDCGYDEENVESTTTMSGLDFYFEQFRKKNFWSINDQRRLEEEMFSSHVLYVLDTTSFTYPEYYSFYQCETHGPVLFFDDQQSPIILWECNLENLECIATSIDINFFEENITIANSGLLTMRTPGTKFGFWLKRKNNERFSLSIRDVSGKSIGKTWNDKNTSEWKHLKLYFGKTLDVFLNGVCVASLDISDLSMPDRITRVELGHVPEPEGMFKGYVRKFEVTCSNDAKIYEQSH